MGKAGRFACIFLPLAATIAALVCIVLAFLGQQNKNDGNLSSIYYFKADTTNFTSNPDINTGNIPNIPGTDLDEKFLSILTSAATSNKLEPIYTVGIWSYCSGPAPAEGDDYKPTFCSPRTTNFYFDPVEVWGLDGTGIQEAFPEKLESGLKVYRSVARWLFTAHATAFFLTVAELIIGLFAIFSRWGSCVTTIVASAATFFTLASAITASALYGTLAGTFNTVLEPYGIQGSLGKNGLVVIWLAAAFSSLAGVLWLVSICCCSGQSREKDYNRTRANRNNTGFGGFMGGARGTTAEKTPYTYEPVSYQPAGADSSWHPGQPVPLQDMETGRIGGHHNGAYEPYRHS